MEDKYLELLESEIKYGYERKVKAQDMADEAEAHAADLREEADKLNERCNHLKLLKARHLCPFKPGDKVKGWDYFNKEASAVVMRICALDSSPFYTVVIDQGNAAYKVHFDVDRLEPADAEEEQI